MLYRLTMHLRWRVLIVLVAAVAAAIALVGQASAANHTHRHRTHHNHRGGRHVRSNDAGNTGSATGLGQLSGLLPASHLTEESAIQVNLSNETVRLPIYPGDAPVPNHPGQTEKVWYLLLDASDQGLAHDLGVNYAPKLANIGISCPACVQTVTQANPSPQANPFGPAVIHFAGAPDFSPTRVAVPGSDRVPAASRSARERWRVRGTARSSGSRARTSSTTRRSSPPAMVRTTSTITPTPATGCWASTSEARRRPASSRSRGPTCCSSRALTPESRSST